jgi:hypothetical protein
VDKVVDNFCKKREGFLTLRHTEQAFDEQVFGWLLHRLAAW